jgi:hypothetical protein
MEISENIFVVLFGAFSNIPQRLEASPDWFCVELLIGLTSLRIVGQTSHEAGTLVQYLDFNLVFRL